MHIAEELQKRNLPDLMTMQDGTPLTAQTWPQRRQELINCLSQHLYGFTPAFRPHVQAHFDGIARRQCFGGKAKGENYTISFDTPTGEYSFPITIALPLHVDKPPVILLLAFGQDYPVPEEEIIDNGFGLVRVFYCDIHPEIYFGDFTKGLGGKFIGNRPRTDTEWGKVGLWAYGASRIMDYLITRDDINTERIAVAGHSRNGKASLWCRAQDPRFFLALGNNSNYGGAGLIRGHIGEDVQSFLNLGSYDFFCEGWKNYLNVPHEGLPFDQHFLLACQAPGFVYVAGATQDEGMDPVSEFLSCCAASDVYKLLGKTGLSAKGGFPKIGESLADGEIGFHVREGTHYFSRFDWQCFMDFFKKHL